MTVVVSCEWMKRIRYSRSGFAGDCRKNLEQEKSQSVGTKAVVNAEKGRENRGQTEQILFGK